MKGSKSGGSLHYIGLGDAWRWLGGELQAQLVEQDLAEDAAAATDGMPMQERLQALEERVAELEQQSL